VTLNDVINDEAVKIGETIAHLLNAGFPLDISLSIAREQSVLGGQYIVVGSGELTVTQQPGIAPFLVEISDIEEEVVFKVITYVNREAGIGTIFKPHINGITEFYLASGVVGEFTLTSEEFKQYIELQKVPVRLEGNLYLDSAITLDFLTD